MNQYVQVTEEENEDPIELPCEDDATLLLSTVVAQFPGACGLKYRNEESGSLRGLRLLDGKIFPPNGQWAGHVYYVVFPKGKFCSICQLLRRSTNAYIDLYISKFLR